MIPTEKSQTPLTPRVGTRRSWKQALRMLMVVLGFAGSAVAESGTVDFAGRQLPQEVEAAGTRLVLYSTAVMRVGLIFRGYAASLYLPPGSSGADALGDIPKRLNIHYLHRTSGDMMIDVAERTMADNLTPSELAAVRERIDRLNTFKRDMPKGANGSLTYVPGKGTTFAVNEEPFLTIEGADFARAYFGVWLAEKPSNDSVKRQLLTPRKREP